MPQPKATADVGFNIQVQKVVDLAGGHETLVLNTQAPPGASAADIYDRIKTMRKAMQMEIDYNVGLERNRQEQEAVKADSLEGFAKGTETPVPAPKLPVDLRAVQ